MTYRRNPLFYGTLLLLIIVVCFLLACSVPALAQTAPAIVPPANGTEKITCTQSNVPKTCTSLQIAQTLQTGTNIWTNPQYIQKGLTGALTSNFNYLFNPQLLGVWSSSDNQTTSVTPGTNIPSTGSIEQYFGGSAVNDGRNALGVAQHMTASTSASNAYRFYAAGNFVADSAFNDSGTGGSPQGYLYGLGGVCWLKSGATYWRSCIGIDSEVAVDAGASTAVKAAFAGGSWPSDAGHGSLVDAGYWLFAAPGAAGFTNGIQIDASGGSFPVTTGGTLFKSNGGTVSNGIDFSGTSISNWLLKGNGVIETTSTAASTSPTTGAVRIAGGVGIAGAVNVGAAGGPTTGLVTITNGTANQSALAVNAYSGTQSNAFYGRVGSQINALEDFGSFGDANTHFGFVVNGGKTVSSANTTGSWNLARIGYTGYGGGTSSSFITAGQAIVQPTPSSFNNTGNFTGWNPECVMVAGMTPTSCVGEEVNILTATGTAPSNIRQGVRIADIGSATGTAGVITDSGIGVLKPSGSLGFRHGLLFGDEGQSATAPIAANGDYIKAVGNSVTLNSYLDFAGHTGTLTYGAILLPANKKVLCLGVPGTCAGGTILGNTTSNGGQIVFNNNSISLNWATAALTVSNTGDGAFLGTNSGGSVTSSVTNADSGASSYARLHAAHGSGSGVEIKAGSTYGVINSVTQSLGLQVGGVTYMTIGTDGNVYPVNGIQLAKKTVASLPTCNSTSEGRMFAVTDASSAVFNAAVAAGGANHVIGYCNGTIWTVH